MTPTLLIPFRPARRVARNYLPPPQVGGVRCATSSAENCPSTIVVVVVAAVGVVAVVVLAVKVHCHWAAGVSHGAGCWHCHRRRSCHRPMMKEAWRAGGWWSCHPGIWWSRNCCWNGWPFPIPPPWCRQSAPASPDRTRSRMCWRLGSHVRWPRMGRWGCWNLAHCSIQNCTETWRLCATVLGF